MIFQPKDEMSLRHLFSTDYAQENFGLSYVGSILNSLGEIEDSPDCIVLDRRKQPFRPLRCEFKFIPLGKEDFAYNGLFDIAIIWALPKGLTRNGLLNDRLQQNACSDLIVLKTEKAFWNLPIYKPDSISKLGDVGVVRKLIMRRSMGVPTVFALCMAARIYPERFSMERMIQFLRKRFPKVERMQDKGRANVITAALMTRPKLLQKMLGNTYRWTSDINNVTATQELTALLRENEAQVPTADDLAAVRE
jgi:hypothetical protein